MGSFQNPIKDVKNDFKYKIKRQRPFQSHPDLKPCLPLESSYSYPSEHATFYSSTSELLAAVYPEHKERLSQVGAAGVSARSNCGVHYPSDVMAGQKLGKTAAAKIMETHEWNSFMTAPGEKVIEELDNIKKSSPMLA